MIPVGCAMVPVTAPIRSSWLSRDFTFIHRLRFGSYRVPAPLMTRPCAQPIIDRTMPAVADAPWRVRVTVAELPAPRSPRAFVADLPDGWPQWLAGTGIPPWTPFLMSPTLDYDVVLNEFFRHLAMLGAAPNTQVGYLSLIHISEPTRRTPNSY